MRRQLPLARAPFAQPIVCADGESPPCLKGAMVAGGKLPPLLKGGGGIHKAEITKPVYAIKVRPSCAF